MAEPSTEASAAEERDSLGNVTGVELEEEQDSPDEIREPFDPEQIDVVTRNMTVDLMLSRVRSGALDLQPDFQRRSGIWTDSRQSRLVESLLLRIPLPTLYAAEDGDEGWAMVDGVQRMTAIARFMDPGAVGADRLFLTGLEYLGASYDGARFEKLPGRLQTRLRESELIVHLIRKGTPEEVKFNIFARINTGGMPLSAQELRHALIPGSARNLLRRMAESDAFRTATNYSIRDERMADREMALRYLAFRRIPAEKYNSQDFDEFLRQAMRAVNRSDSPEQDATLADFERSMEAATTIFGEYAFRKQYERTDRLFPINKALFEAVSVTLSECSDDRIRTLVENRDEVNRRFAELTGTDYYFERAISQGTGDVAKVRMRFRKMQDLFRSVAP